MGAWGTAVFADDGACDARDGFRELIAEGFSTEDATARLVSEYAFPSDDRDGGGEWIGLAVTQWRTGRLLDWVRDRALQAIAAESEELWTDPADWRQRQKVLASTVQMLNSPQRQPVKIKREAIQESPFAAGDVVRFTLESGREVALWALTRKEHRTLVRVSVDTPFIVLAFGEPKLDPVEDIVQRRPVLITYDGGHSSFTQLHLWLPQHAQEPRWSVIGNAPVPSGCQDPRRFDMPLRLRVRGHKPYQLADAKFAAIYEESKRLEPTAATEAALALGELVPSKPRLWDGFFHTVPREAAIALADLMREGDPGPLTEALALADQQLDGPPAVRSAGLEFIDRLLCIASHPESGVPRDQIPPLLGTRATQLVPAIDAAWHRMDSIPQLDPRATLTPLHAYASSRRLDDGTYVIWDLPSLDGPTLRRSPAASL